MRSYAEVAEPSVQLTRKSTLFEWSAEREGAFIVLKTMLISPQVMAYPNLQKPYRLYTDACDYAVGGILVQVDDTGLERVVQYISHQLSPTQRRWATIEKEAYAVVYALTKLRTYLFGSDFVVYTDHKPLKSLFTKEMVNTKIQRWAVLLAEYGAKIEYRRGKNNIRADMLSRISSEAAEVAIITDRTARAEDLPDATDIDDRTDNLSIDSVPRAQLIRNQEREFPEELRDANEGEDSDYVIRDGLLCSERPPYPGAEVKPRIMLTSRYRANIIKRAHIEVGHMAAHKTQKRIVEDYVWPGLRKDVRLQLRACAICEAYHRRPVHVQMQDVEIPHSPMEIVGLDFIGPFPVDEFGRKYLLTAIDYLSGWAEAYPTRTQSAQDIIEAIANEFLPRHGYPRAFISDNGQGFKSRRWSEFLANASIECRRTTPVHPQGNAKVERFNRTYKEAMAKLVLNKPNDWADRVGDILSAYRKSVSNSTGFSPFYLLYGRRPRAPLERFLGDSVFGDRLDQTAEAYKQARSRLLESRKYNRERLDKLANANTSLNIGDTVTVKAEERRTNTSRWDPEYEVIRVRGTTHWVRHQSTGRERKLHREKLTLVDPNIAWDEIPHRPRRNPVAR
jgi:transposase InsO family protein